MASRDLSTLARILEAERKALLDGRVSDLGGLSEAKVRALAGIAGDREVILAAKAKLARNARMIEAAISGLRAALDRGGERRAVEAGFSTYKRTGEKLWIGPEHGRNRRTDDFASNAAHRASRD